MQMPSKNPYRPRDANQLAKRIIDVATGQVSDDTPGPTGHAIGGYARAARMTPEERSEAARHAATARWGIRET